MPPRLARQAPNENAQIRQQIDMLAQQMTALQTQLNEIANRLPPIREPARDIDPRAGDLPSNHGSSDEDDPFMDDNPFAGLRRQPRHIEADDRRWENSFKLDLPEFDGSGDPETFLDWLNATEELLDFKQVPMDRRAALVVTRLRGRATAWWQQLKHTRHRQGKQRITAWDKFIKYLRREFLPFNYSRILFQNLQALRQGPRTVDDYSRDFYQLIARIDLRESDEQLVTRYIGGLRMNLQDTLSMFSPGTVSEAHQRAILLEKQQSRRATTPSTSTAGRFSTPESRPPPPQQGGSRQHNTRPGACFSCGEMGHRQSACPKLQQGRALLADETETSIYTDPPVYEEDTTLLSQEEVLHGDMGQTLILRRSCLTPHGDNDLIQRHNIFASTCTINGKVCRFIIDSGSSENVIAADVVPKLSLKPETHPLSLFIGMA